MCIYLIIYIFFCFTELPVLSPLIHGILRNLEQWEHCLRDELDRFPSPPSNYIPGCCVDSSGSNVVSIMKYSSLMDPENTPFASVPRKQS